MKKILSLLIVFALLFAASACGGPAAEPTSAAAPGSETAPPSGSEAVSAQPNETDPAGPSDASQPEETEAPAPEDTALTERCGVFSVSLPDWWEGRYIALCEQDGIWFRFKTAPDDAEGIALFGISLSDGPDDIENPGFGGVGIDYEICKTEKDGLVQYLMLSEPGEYSGVPDDSHDEYMAMLRLTNDIETRLHGENGYELTLFDYTDALGVYTAEDGAGGEYTLSLMSTQWNLLFGELAFHVDGELVDEIENVQVRMFSNAGSLSWYRQTDADADEWESGSGVFIIEQDTDETGYSLMLTAYGDSWTTTDGYLPLQRWQQPR